MNGDCTSVKESLQVISMKIRISYINCNSCKRSRIYKARILVKKFQSLIKGLMNPLKILHLSPLLVVQIEDFVQNF